MKSGLKEDQKATRIVQELPSRPALERVEPAQSTAARAYPETALRPVEDDFVLARDLKAWEWFSERPTAALDDLDGGLTTAGTTSVTRGTALERMEQLVTREVTLFRQIGADSLTVVLKPDPHTEVVLQLRQHPDHLEAQLRCESEMHQLLARDWPSLKESLAGLNVKLLPLQENPTPQFYHHPTGSNGSQLSDNALADSNLPRREQAAPGQPEDVPFTTSPNPTPKAPGARLRRAAVTGWETWA